jgi:hypothetical protein
MAGVQYGVVCSGGPEARVAIPELGMVVSARSLAVDGTRRLDNYDFILGVDVKGETHLWSRRRGIVSRRDGDDVVDTHDVTEDDVGRYLQWVEQGRGWRVETLCSRFARVLDEEGR